MRDVKIPVPTLCFNSSSEGLDPTCEFLRERFRLFGKTPKICTLFNRSLVECKNGDVLPCYECGISTVCKDKTT